MDPRAHGLGGLDDGHARAHEHPALAVRAADGREHRRRVRAQGR